MSLLLEIYVIFAILTKFSFVLASDSPGEGTGQKAHFSLEDTPGSFTVHATKILAKVSSKPDSIKVIVKPGMAEFPVPQLPTQKPLLHIASPAIVRPVGGWNFMSFGRRKRSKFANEKESSGKIGKENEKHKHFGKYIFKRSGIHAGHSTYTVGKSIKLKRLGKIRSRIEIKEGKRNSSKSFDEKDGKHNFERDLFKRLRRKNTVKKSLVKPRKANVQSRFENFNSDMNIANRFGRTKIMHRILDTLQNFRKLERVKGNVHVKSGQKRESVARNMKVKGGAGTFSLHVDKKLSNVSSSTGGVEIFIKNPSPKQISQLPQEMLQLPGAMLQLPTGMSQLYSRTPQSPLPVVRSPVGISQLPKEKPWVLVRMPYDWTGASNMNDKRSSVSNLEPVVQR